VVAAAGADPQLLIHDVDLDIVSKVRDTVAVLRNRTPLAELGRSWSAQFGRAQSLG